MKRMHGVRVDFASRALLHHLQTEQIDCTRSSAVRRSCAVLSTICRRSRAAKSASSLDHSSLTLIALPSLNVRSTWRDASADVAAVCMVYDLSANDSHVRRELT